MASRYIPELVYSLAISSLSVHLLFQRRSAFTESHQITARISILEELTTRLRAGEDIPDAEVARLRKLGRDGGEKEGADTEVGWKDVIFGRKVSKTEDLGREDLDRRDLDQVQRAFSAENSKS